MLVLSSSLDAFLQSVVNREELLLRGWDSGGSWRDVSQLCVPEGKSDVKRYRQHKQHTLLSNK